MMTALILKKGKNRTGYTFLLLTPEEGFCTVYLPSSRKKMLPSLQVLFLVEVDTKDSPRYQIPEIIDTTVVFIFGPPNTSYEHFFNIQKILYRIYTSYRFNHLEEKKSQLFMLTMSLLSANLNIQTIEESEMILLAFFMKFNLIYKVHEEILYCFSCQKKVVSKSYLEIDLSQHKDLPAFICHPCKLKYNIPVLPLGNKMTQDIHDLLFQVLLEISQKRDFLKTAKEFLFYYITYYFGIPEDELFWRTEKLSKNRM